MDFELHFNTTIPGPSICLQQDPRPGYQSTTSSRTHPSIYSKFTGPSIHLQKVPKSIHLYTISSQARPSIYRPIHQSTASFQARPSVYRPIHKSTTSAQAHTSVYNKFPCPSIHLQFNARALFQKQNELRVVLTLC